MFLLDFAVLVEGDKEKSHRLRLPADVVSGHPMTSASTGSQACARNQAAVPPTTKVTFGGTEADRKTKQIKTAKPRAVFLHAGEYPRFVVTCAMQGCDAKIVARTNVCSRFTVRRMVACGMPGGNWRPGPGHILEKR